jgi:hypothetical protein
MRETKTLKKPPGTGQIGGLYQWRDRQGNFHHPGEMESRHIFHTVAMIWNHTMPIKTRPDYQRYEFGPYYTKDYLKLSVVMLVKELFRRDDLKPEWMATLDMMHAFVKSNEERLLSND